MDEDGLGATRRELLQGSAALAVAATPALAMRHDLAPGSEPRERVALDGGWRFRRGDPEDAGRGLIYDFRPPLTPPDEEQPSAAKAADAVVLKPWILPSGNAFIADPARRHARPAGDPGGDLPFVQADFDDGGWTPVTLPHDWAIDQPFITEGDVGGMGRLPSWGIGWYRRRLDIPAADAGRSIFLDIDGAMSYAAVWLNGRLVGGWPYGYNSWRLDLTPHIVPGRMNQLAIRLDNPPQSSRWYPGGGLYRRVWLVKTDRVHVGQWGTVVTTPQVSAASATVELAVTLDNDGASPVSAQVATTIHALDAAGLKTGPALARIAPAPLAIEPHGRATATGSALLTKPLLWGPPPHQQPHRHLAETVVSVGGRIVDRYETRFGIRTIGLDPNAGISVNGEPVDLQGTNNHHDLGALGAAFNRRAAERQLEMLRAMGCNALRMSHNPPDSELLELADEMGFLVLAEIFDCWEMKKTPLDFHLIFADWHEPDLRAMLRRDRNHPSIFLWSIGNEVGEQTSGEAGAVIARALVRIVGEEDPTRPTTSAMNAASPEDPLPAIVDVIGLNYQGIGVRTRPGTFAAFHDRFPGKVILSTESAAALSSRGDYQFPVSGSVSGPVRPGSGGDPRTHQVSAYELYAADFGSSADRCFSQEDQHPFQAGEFVWTGWDYLGEPTPYYSSRSSYFGIIDLAGFAKDRFFLYQSRWRPDLPMAHILPHWTWPGREGEVTPVHVFTSGDEAELFVNGVSQGRQTRAPFQYRFRWDYVVYRPGELRVVTWRDGKPWATTVTRTADPAARLAMAADRAIIRADGHDLAFVSLSVLDANGALAPRAADRVAFTLDGPGEIVATDNGDATDLDSFASPSRRAFNGRALAIVRALPGRPGTITLRARAAGLTGCAAIVRTT